VYLTVPGIGNHTSVDLVLGMQTAASFWCFLYHTVAAQSFSQGRVNDLLVLDESIEKVRFISFFRCSEGLERGSGENTA
jgi:hypothetical protein